MIPIRHSLADRPNQEFRWEAAESGEGNRSWLRRAPSRGALLLLGGDSLTDRRIRFAQSGLRHDLTSSRWSMCGLLTDADRFLSVPLRVAEPHTVPERNAIELCDLADYDDPDAYPNICTIRFADDEAAVVERAQRLAPQRSVIDLPALLAAWLAYVWGVPGTASPLEEGRGVPSAAFVETAYGLAGIELTPSLSSASSCPEAIWQAAKWWHHFYEDQPTDVLEDAPVRPVVPSGTYVMREQSPGGGDGG